MVIGESRNEDEEKDKEKAKKEKEVTPKTISEKRDEIKKNKQFCN